MNDVQTKDLMNKLNEYFESTVEIPRMRVGKRQTVETLIFEKALLFGKYIRNEKETWVPKVSSNKIALAKTVRCINEDVPI